MFVPLRVRSHFSLGYGTASIPELVEEAVRRRLPALALTDVDNLYGQVEFHHACRAAGIQAITGVELGGRVFLAKNRAGYEHLCRAVTTRDVGDLDALHDPGPPVALISREDHALHA